MGHRKQHRRHAIEKDLSTTRATVMLDNGRSVAFDVKDYNQIDHGYAATVHKTQGVTVDRTYVLATPGLDRHSAYVALSRHRDGVDLHYGRDDFADQGRLVRTLSRDRAKDMASDYVRTFAARREITFGEKIAELARKVPDKARGMFDGLRLGSNRQLEARGIFDGLKLNAQPVATEPARASFDRAVEQFARATQAIVAVRGRGGEPLPHQVTALNTASKALDTIRPSAARDVREAFTRDPGLIDEAAKGRSAQAIRAMTLEAEVRMNPAARADRFIEDWSKLATREQAFRRAYDDRGVARIRADMGAMAKSLERDPQIESLVRQRLPQIGIRVDSAASLSHDLQRWLNRSRDIGLSL